jgi:hypothetical protein
MLAALAVAVVYLKLVGRVWWCACDTPTLFAAEVNSQHNSQHLFDWYSFTHVLHGVIFFWVLHLALPWLAVMWRLAIAVVIETGWEMVENSPAIIDRYREATAAFGYEGDSIVNVAGDLLCCVGGFFIARSIGLRLSVLLFAGVESVLLLFIRDNLTLNVIMLIWPIEAIRQWQLLG